jgi:hypothetical protein
VCFGVKKLTPCPLSLKKKEGVVGCLDLDFMLLYPDGCISAEFLGVGFIEWGEEFEDGICWSVALSWAKAVEFAAKMISHVRAVLPDLLNEIWGDVVDENKSPVDYVWLCHL